MAVERGGGEPVQQPGPGERAHGGVAAAGGRPRCQSITAGGQHCHRPRLQLERPHVLPHSRSEALRPLGIRLSQEDKGKIINGSHEIIFAIISKLKEIHQRTSKESTFPSHAAEITIKDIDPKREVAAADSLLELFLLALIKHFGLSPKEALSLLSNDSKYLAHILAKGLKGDFRPIDAFIAELQKNLPKIVAFCRNKENESFLFRSIKPALISKS